MLNKTICLFRIDNRRSRNTFSFNLFFEQVLFYKMATKNNIPIDFIFNEEVDDLDIFAKFEVAPKTNIYVDEEYRFGENGDIIANEQIDPKHYLKFKGDGVSVNVLEETCAASAFFLTDDKIKRIYLC